MKRLILAAAIAALATLPALAQSNSHSGHEGMSMTAAPKGDTGPASTAYAAANAKMHQDMDITFTGDADADFVHGMIAHHQGAIDMAKVVIEYGKDPAIRKLAEEIVTAQEGEIAFMREWLASSGK